MRVRLGDRFDARQFAVGDRQLAWIIRYLKPVAVFGNADRDYFVPIPVDRPQYISGAEAGNCVLGPFAAEDDCHAYFALAIHKVSLAPRITETADPDYAAILIA